MKKLIFILLVLSFQHIKAINVICIQRGSQTFIETRLDSAVLHAQNDDVIYLPGGLVFGSNVTVNKRLTIIGCGNNGATTLATNTTQVNDINFGINAENSQCMGLYVNSNVTLNCSIKLFRCHVNNLYLQSGSENSIISENDLINIYSNVTNGGLLYIQNNLLYRIAGLHGVSILNNVFRHSSNVSCMDDIQNCFFMNNIFLWIFTGYYGFYYNSNCFNNHFQNNVFAMSYNFLDVYNSNTTEYNNLFNTYPSFDQNYRLLLGSPGIGFGTDGTDVGIYGSTHPFKEGSIPYNPHYQLINIPSSVTNQNGTLNVNFQIDAQDH